MAAQPNNLRLRLLYGNLNHAALSNTELLASAVEQNADILAIAEPYLQDGQVPNSLWGQFVEGQAALLVRPHLAPVTFRVPCNVPNTVCIHLAGIYFLSVYIPPSVDIATVIPPLTGFLLSLDDPICIVGDFNATTSLLAGHTTNDRGEHLEQLLFTCQLDLQNPDTPTLSLIHI